MRSDAAVNEPGLAEKVCFLSDGAHLGEPAAQVERVETHFAWVFLTPNVAYKLRKPGRHGGGDASRLAARRAICDEEFRLNQALAPGVYFGVVPLALGPDGSLAFGRAIPPDSEGRWRTIDWLLHMRRLPAARMLDRMIRDGTVRGEDLEALGAHLDRFYRHGPGLPISGREYCRRLGAAIRQNRETLLTDRSGQVDVAVVEETTQLQQQWLVSNRRLLRKRAEQRAIRDCHGDLKPEHVCLGPPVRVIDRLDLDPVLRELDPVEDLALLWLECERLGAPDIGERIIRRHVAEHDAGLPEPLLFFYLSNRALTRARLAVWRLAEPDTDRALWQRRLHTYASRALTAVQQAGPTDCSVGAAR